MAEKDKLEQYMSKYSTRILGEGPKMSPLHLMQLEDDVMSTIPNFGDPIREVAGVEHFPLFSGLEVKSELSRRGVETVFLPAVQVGDTITLQYRDTDSDDLQTLSGVVRRPAEMNLICPEKASPTLLSEKDTGKPLFLSGTVIDGKTYPAIATSGFAMRVSLPDQGGQERLLHVSGVEHVSRRNMRFSPSSFARLFHESSQQQEVENVLERISAGFILHEEVNGAVATDIQSSGHQRQMVSNNGVDAIFRFRSQMGTESYALYDGVSHTYIYFDTPHVAMKVPGEHISRVRFYRGIDIFSYFQQLQAGKKPAFACTSQSCYYISDGQWDQFGVHQIPRMELYGDTSEEGWLAISTDPQGAISLGRQSVLNASEEVKGEVEGQVARDAYIVKTIVKGDDLEIQPMVKERPFVFDRNVDFQLLNRLVTNALDLV